MSIFEYNKEEEEQKFRKAEYEAGYDSGYDQTERGDRGKYAKDCVCNVCIW